MSLRKRRCRDMSSLDTATWLPPARLADRTASSARWSRSLLLSRPAMPTATPTLTVRVIMWPPSAIRSRSATHSSSAVFSAGSIDIGRSGTTTNSSPPSRAVMLPGPAFKQLFGECPDEPVAGAVAEVIVDRLQPVEVEVQHRDRTGPPHCEPVGKMGDQRAAVVQTGQIVVLGEVAKLLFGCDPCLKLCKQRGDGLDRVEFVGPPLFAAKFHAGELAGRDSPRDQWCRGRRGRGDPGGIEAPAVVGAGNPAWVSRLGRFWPDHDQVLPVLAQRQDGVGAAEVCDRLGVRACVVTSRWPRRDQPGNPDFVVVMAQKRSVDIEMLDELGEHLLVHVGD